MKTKYHLNTIIKGFGLLLFALFLNSISLNAQPVPDPGFDWCEGRPTHAELPTLNRFLAFSNAPIFFQQTHFAGVGYDIPVGVNFDGNFISTDNWNNAPSINPFTTTASVFYTVLWTESYFIITYSLFYPRNWTLCNGANSHNNDLERVVITLDRCTNEGAIVTTNHRKKDFDNCLEETTGFSTFPISSPPIVPDETNDPLITPGNHPLVFISWGSHALYLNFHAALKDGWNYPNPCHPNIVNTCWRYLSPNPGATPAGICASGYYNLVDVFAPGGLWDMRATPGLFFGPNLDNFDCGGKSCGVSTPWNGELGCNPLDYFKNKKICHNQIADEEFIYNGYKCSGYEMLVAPDEICPGESFEVRIVTSCTSEASNVLSVDWNIPDGITCNGCDTDWEKVEMVADDRDRTGVIRAAIKLNDGSERAVWGTINIDPQVIPRDFIEAFPTELCVGDHIFIDLSPFAPQWNITVMECGTQTGNVRILDPFNIDIFVRKKRDIKFCWSAVNSCGTATSGEITIKITDECAGGGFGGPRYQQNTSATDQLTAMQTASSASSEETEEGHSRNQQSSVNSLLTTDVKVFPNPFQSTLSIEYQSPATANHERIVITDLLGKVLFQSNETIPAGSYMRRKTLQLDNWTSGIYLLHLQAGDLSITRKLTKTML